MVSEDRGAGPFGQRPATVADGRLALVGDASGCLDPITGEGLSLAFGQASALVGAITTGDLDGYVAEHRRLMQLPSMITRLLLAVGLEKPFTRMEYASPVSLALSGEARKVSRLPGAS